MIRTRYLTWNDVPALIDLEQTNALLGLSIDPVRRYCVSEISRPFKLPNSSMWKN